MVSVQIAELKGEREMSWIGWVWESVRRFWQSESKRGGAFAGLEDDLAILRELRKLVNRNRDWS